MGNDTHISGPLAERGIKRLAGIGVSRGVAQGRVVIFDRRSSPSQPLELKDKQIDAEIERFRDAVETARLQLIDISQAPDDGQDHAVSDIFSVHLLILDSSLVEMTESIVREQKVNAEWALKKVVAEYTERLKGLGDSHMREKYLDIEDVAGRIARQLKGNRQGLSIDPDSIVVARDLKPSTVMELARGKANGIVTESGGWTSHMSIIAREFGIPMITGVRNARKLLSDSDVVTLDGDSGEVILSATNLKKEDSGNASDIRTSTKVSPAVVGTTDGVEIVIRANSEDPEAFDPASPIARGIGLYRSETLVGGDGVLPTEDEQYAAYLEIAQAAGNAGVAIRTFDVSAEQMFCNFDHPESNPALGLRAIRASLADTTVFLVQIRAILKASAKSRIDIILPMISNVEEIIRSRTLIESVRRDLLASGLTIPVPRIGIMVELPASVLAASKLFRHADFICLGTNDLVQYVLGVDRDNNAVADWYQSLHPAVLTAIRTVLKVAADEGIPATVCGEMAGSPFYVPVLVGLGTREISVNIHSIPPVASLLSSISVGDAEKLVTSLDECETAEETELLLRKYYSENWSDFFPAGLIRSKHR